MNKAPKEKEDKTQYSVTILSRRDIVTFPRLGERKVVVQVTYIGESLPPKTLRIAKEEYSLETEKALIKADIEKRLAEKPEGYRV